MTTDISEKGLETIIVTDMIGGGWLAGCPSDFDRKYAIDAVQLFSFLRDTQPDEWEKLTSANFDNKDDFERKKFLTRLDDELKNRGVIDLLKNGIQYLNTTFDLYCYLPSDDNEQAAEEYAKNRFSVTRQLKFSEDSEESLDLGMFINGLPVITAELKNNLTRQTVRDAVDQYCLRNQKEKLFAHGRCAVHFALDEHSVRMCTHLRGKESKFYPFNKGSEGGAGNPPNLNGFSTDYLWKDVLQPDSLAEIVENYALFLRQDKQQIWPRYHQRDAVRQLLGRVQKEGVGRRYLVQHSAGSGKSKTIAWLAHQLADLYEGSEGVFDSIFVVSNRRVLDGQLRKDIQNFSGNSAIADHANNSRELCRLIEIGKKVIVTTVQKFPFIVDSLRSQEGKKFAIIIDEAHTGQGGKTAAEMNAALGGEEQGDAEMGADDTGEDVINAELEKLEQRMKNRKPLKNASYFAFTATPKAKTLELFGEPQEPTEDGKIPHLPHHVYWMRQAIEEKFILDVLAFYMPVKTAFHIIKTIADDPKFDAKRAQKKLRKFVETHPENIAQKAEVMAKHFYEGKIDRNINNQARAMVVCNGIAQAVKYYFALRACLKTMGKTDQVWVAFSGEHEYDGKMVTESSLNGGVPEHETAARFRKEQNARFLVCADKFQVGYDEPLLQVMYVDKPLSGVMAVQTLSRINRIYPQKDNCMVLDFCNDQKTIEEAFQDYYQTTVLTDKADPNKLHSIKSWLDSACIYEQQDVEKVVQVFLDDDDRKKLEILLSVCRDKYNQKDVNEQIKFKSDAKSFCRFYDFIAIVLPYNMPEWEKLSIFLTLLIPKLPAPNDEDLSRDIVGAVDMESYRIRKQEVQNIGLEEEDGEINPIEEQKGGGKSEPEMEPLSRILSKFNQKFQEFFSEYAELEEAFHYLKDTVIPMVESDETYMNSLRNTPNEARNDCYQALEEVRLKLNHEEEEMLNKLYHKEGECWNRVCEWVYDRTKTKAG